MGRTVLPFSQVLEQEVQEWRKFRRGLRREDQQFLDRLFEEARLHVQAGVYASRPWPFETILISILLEHEKALVELRSKLRSIEKKGCHSERQRRIYMKILRRQLAPQNDCNGELVEENPWKPEDGFLIFIPCSLR